MMVPEMTNKHNLDREKGEAQEPIRKSQAENNDLLSFFPQGPEKQGSIEDRARKES